MVLSAGIRVHVKPESAFTFRQNDCSRQARIRTRDIIAAAVKALDRIWVNGHRYAKAGCMLNDFTPDGVSQLNLFDDTQPRSNSNQLMKVMDGINHSGKGKIWFAGRGIAPEWQMKRELLSPAYTTRWADIPAAKLT